MKAVVTILCFICAAMVAVGQTIIGPETTQTLPSSAYWYRVIGNWPDSNAVQQVNPPVFKWIYDETIPLTASNDVRYFHFQLSTNATPFSSTYWDITCSNNFYNFVPPITNADGSTYTGPCFWRIKYYNSNMTFVATGQTNIFHMASGATLWDRSMLADTNYLLSIATNHPHMYFTWTNISALAAWRQSNPFDFHNQSYTTLTNLQVTFYQAQSWWGNHTITNGTALTLLGAISGAELCAFDYYLSGSNSMFDISGACASLDFAASGFQQQNLDFEDPYQVDPGGEQTMALAYDWLYPFMTSNQRSNVEYELRSLCYYAAYGGDCFYGSANFTPTNRDYPYYPFAVPHESIFKLGSSHNRYDVPVATMASIAAMGEDPQLLALFPMFENYSVFQLDPYQGDEGRGYSEQGNLKFDRELSAAIESIVQFPQAKLGLSPVLTNLTAFFDSWEPMGHRGVFEPWGDLTYGFLGQGYHYRYHDIANIENNGAILRQYNRYYNSFRQSSADEFPQLGEAFMNYYFTKPSESDFPTNSYFDPVRGWVMAGSLPSSDFGAFTNGVSMFFLARPGGRNVDHGSFADGQVELQAFGADCTAGGAAQGYAKHPMYYNSLMVNGIGTHMAAVPPSDPVYSFIDHWTNNAEFTYASGDITLAFNRSNTVTSGLGNMTEPFYNQSTNLVPQVSKVRRHVFFPHKRYLVIYDELQTTTNATFQFLWHIAETNSIVNTNGCSFTYTCTNTYNGSNVTVYAVPFSNPSAMGLLNEYGTNLAKFNPFTKENYMGLDNDTGPWYSSTVWVTNRTATTNWHFGYVIYPAKWGQSAPTITRITDNSVEVNDGTFSDGISWGETNATVQSAVANYYILNTLNSTTNIGGGSGGGITTVPTYAPVYWR